MVKFFSDRPRVPSMKENRALMAAAVDGDALALVQAINDGADLNYAEYTDGRTPAYMATARNHPECLETLIKAGADITKDSAGCTPLSLSAAHKDARCLSLLLGAGVRTDTDLTFCVLPTVVAAKSGNYECLSLLLDEGEPLLHKQSALNVAVTNGYADCVKIILDSGFDPDSEGKYSEMAIEIAINKGHGECLRHLVEAGVDIRKRNRYKLRPADLAVKENNPEVILILMDAGLDIEEENSNGQKILAIAKENNWEDVLSRFEKTKIQKSIRMSRDAREKDSSISL